MMRWTATLAWSLCGLTALLTAGSTAFTVWYWQPLISLGGDLAPSIVALLGGVAMIASFAIVGALIVARHPANVIGWIFLGTSVNFALWTMAGNYAVYALLIRPVPLPGRTIAAWWADVGNSPSALFPYLFLFLLFPHGRLLSPGWRPLAWLAVVTMLLLIVSRAVYPGPLRTFPFVTNPFGIAAAKSVLDVLAAPMLAAMAMLNLGSALALVLRFRRSRGTERQQLKWFASASGVVGLVFVTGPFLWIFAEPSLTIWLWPLLFFAAIILLPTAAGSAILRYRLYDIDVIINRALVYGTVTAILALLYIGSVVLLQQVVRILTGSATQFVIVASTLLIAALAQPLRRRLQQAIDRRFFRQKYDAATTLEAFGARLRNETDLQLLAGDLIQVVDRTLQPEHLGLWLREAEVRR